MEKKKSKIGLVALPIMILAAALLRFLPIGKDLYQQYIQPHTQEVSVAAAKQYQHVAIDLQALELASNVWKISKDGLPDSYLLGTYHIGKTGATMNPQLRELVSKNDTIITEVSLNLSQQEVETLQQFMRRKPLTENSVQDHLGKEEYLKLLSKIRTYPPAHSQTVLDNLSQYRPWAAMFFISSLKKENETSETGVDALVMEQAQQLGKKQEYLETFTEAVSYFALPSESLSVAMLKDWANDPEEDDNEELKQAYAQGQFAQLPRLMEKEMAYDADDTTLTPEEHQAMADWLLQDMLVARNKNWLPHMVQATKQQPTLFAVGIGHLMSNHGLIAMLRAEGYTVTPEPPLLVWE